MEGCSSPPRTAPASRDPRLNQTRMDPNIETRMDQSRPAEDDGTWTTVKHNKRRRTGSGNEKHQEVSTPKATTLTSAPFPKFKIKTTNPEMTSYAAVTALERKHPTAKFTARPNLKGEMVLHPQDEASAKALEQGNNTSTIQVEKLDPALKETKSVVLRYPKEFPLEPLSNHQRVIKAERCTMPTDKTAKTRQVIITHLGPSPSSINLQTWGKYEVRPYVPEPLRCYKCQRYGHHQSTCTYKPRCAICSYAHQTADCMAKLKRGEVVPAKCINCQKKHHAWNPSCPERVKRVQAGRPQQQQQQPQQQQPQQQQPHQQLQQQSTASVKPAPPGTFKWGTPAPRLENNRDFPALVREISQAPRLVPNIHPSTGAIRKAPRPVQKPARVPTPARCTTINTQPKQDVIKVSELSKVLINFAEGLAHLLGQAINSQKLTSLMTDIFANTVTPTKPAPTTTKTVQLTPRQLKVPKHSTPNKKSPPPTATPRTITASTVSQTVVGGQAATVTVVKKSMGPRRQLDLDKPLSKKNVQVKPMEASAETSTSSFETLEESAINKELTTSAETSQETMEEETLTESETDVSVGTQQQQ